MNSEMRRRPIVTATLFALVLSLAAVTRDAAAEETDTSSASAVKRSVRVGVRLQREKDAADVLVERHGVWTLACRAPCTFEAVAGEEVHVDMQGLIEEPLVFTVPADGRAEHDIEVRRRGDGLFVGGLVAIGAGAISLALGMAIIRGAGKEDLFGEGNRAVASIAMVLGAASAVTGAVLILRRSTTPFIAPSSSPSPSPPTRAQAVEDVGVAPTRSLGVDPVRLALPQLVWSARF